MIYLMIISQVTYVLCIMKTSQMHEVKGPVKVEGKRVLFWGFLEETTLNLYTQIREAFTVFGPLLMKPRFYTSAGDSSRSINT